MSAAIDPDGAAPWRWLSALVIAGVAAWYVVFVTCGPRLALNHDELSFLSEALRLPREHRLTGYSHGPLLYEILAVVEIAWYAIARLSGAISTPMEFLTSFILNEPAHLLVGRALVGVTGLLVLVQVHRLGAVFGGPAAGTLAMLLCATNFTFISMSSVLKEDTLFWLLLVTALLEAWTAVERRSTFRALLAGAIIGAAAVTKYFGAVGFALVALPFVRTAPLGWRGSSRLAFAMTAGAVVAVLVLMPFLVTDTRRVIESVTALEASWAQLGGERTLGAYATVHLPNVVGWIVLIGGAVELLRRVFREPRGPVMLVAVPLALLVILGMRRGSSIAYYVFPLAIVLFVLVSSLVVRLAARGPARWRWVLPAAVGVIAFVGPPYLPSSIKHALVLTAPDTRVVARDYLHRHATPGECIVVTDGIVGMNFWGPPLLPAELPAGDKPFAVATRRAQARLEGPRYQVRVVDRFKPVSDDLRRECRWLVSPRIDPHDSVEFGAAAVDPAATIPPGFVIATIVRGIPEPQASVWPFPVSLDYAEVRKHSIRSLWSARRRGHTLVIYRHAQVSSAAHTASIAGWVL